MYIISHNSLLDDQAAVSQRNDHMLTWLSSTGGGASPSCLITDAWLPLLRNCPGEHIPLRSAGDPTAHEVLGTQSYPLSARSCLSPYFFRMLPCHLHASPSGSLLASCPLHTLTSTGIKALFKIAVYFSDQLCFLNL